MSKTFIKIMTITAGIFLVAFAFVYIIRTVANMGVSGEDSGPTVTLESVADGSTITANNPARSPNFADVGADVYVSDERQLGKTVGFSMSYYAEDGSFAIDISSKPLALYRQKASEYLLETLQITEAEACQLRVYVGVTHDTDSSLVGKNLGLSFCPGSVQL